MTKRPDTWTIANTRHDAPALARHNSVFTISNGYLGLSGTVQEDRSGFCPLTLINGVYDELDMFGQLRASASPRPWLDPAHFDGAGKSPAVANLPTPLYVRVFVGDREVSLTRGRITDFRQHLFMADGVYSYAYDCLDAAGRTTRIEMTRFASMAAAHRVYMRFAVTPLDHDAPIRILSGISGAVRSCITGERQFVVTERGSASDGTCLLRARTPARGIDVDVGVGHAIGERLAPQSVRPVVEHDGVYVEYEFASRTRVPIVIDRFIVLASTEDARHGIATDTREELDSAAGLGFNGAVDEQRGHWQRIWELADVEVAGDDLAQRYLRFCTYHLIAAAPRFTGQLSVPVKLLSGQHYQGNTFWDTDLYIVPFYTFTLPEIARHCLEFRFVGLEPGRAIAREQGYDGAKFAWQAGPNGEECLGPWYRFTRTNIHINADVAYALMQYVRATGDQAFMWDRGVDILVESARFYASRAVHDAERDAFDLRGVAGPDEAHCDSTNNFYTNTMAAHTLRWAADTLDRPPGRDTKPHQAAVKRLGVRHDEPARWRRVADGLTLLYDERTKRYEQCEGFYRLPPPPDDLLAERNDWFAPLSPFQALNQPDVLMAMMLFRDEFDADVKRANRAYYKDKSMDFSSMAFPVNALLAADLGELDDAYRNFMIAAGMDLDESLTGRRDTADGLHGTAMGGAWMAAVFGFGGVGLSDKGLQIDPRLPGTWSGLRFKLAVRGQRVEVAIDREAVTLSVEGDGPLALPVTVAGQEAAFDASGGCRIAL